MFVPSDYLELEQLYMQTLGRGLTSITVCAANAKEGVSTVACALAERHQRAGKHTLLVDMNLFRPSLAERYQMTRTDWQVGNASVQHAVATVKSGFDVLTASQAPAQGFRQIEVIQSMLATWLEHYDAVVFDTSPINAINRHNIPAEFLCSCSMGTLMVVKSGVTLEEELQSAVHKLQAFGVNIVGVVMNDMQFPSLRDEMVRETYRISRKLPQLSARLRRWITSCHMFNIRF